MRNMSCVHRDEQASGSPIRSPGLTEISSPERSPSEERLLLHELSHRINNEFASAISLIALAAARSANTEVKIALDTLQDRLQSYAQVHHVLQMPEHGISIEGNAYLRQLCRAISRSKLDSRDIELVFVERAFQMSSERCWRLGLILSELIANSARHAFRDSGGLIRVELLPSRTFVECRVTDNGVGEANIRRGRGLEIVEGLTKSFQGSIDQHFGPQGATSVLIIPLCPRMHQQAVEPQRDHPERVSPAAERTDPPAKGVRRGKAALSSGCKSQEQPARLQI
jgi:two-component sensor histidine kinase